MAVAFSQHASGTTPSGSSPTNGTLVLPSVADGDTILLLVAQAADALSSVSGCGATWTQLRASSGNEYGETIEMWVGIVATASGSTISFSNPSNVIIDAVAMSFTGAAQGVIASSVATGTSTAALCSTSDPFEAGQAVAVFPIFPVDGNGHVGAPPSGYTDSPSAFTTVDEYVASGNNLNIDSAYKITAGAGTYSRQANIVSAAWMAFTALLSADPFPSGQRPKAPQVHSRAVMRAAVI